MLLKTFINSQFNFFPLMWICYSRGLNNSINNLHERALRIVCQSKKLDFAILPKNDRSGTIYRKNLHYFVTEINKVKNNISPDIMRHIFHFQENENCNLRSGTHPASRNMRTTLFEKETVSNLKTKTWSLFSEELRNASFLQVFKNNLRKSNQQIFHVDVKTYIKHVGFI